jgi:hypothetical protein
MVMGAVLEKVKFVAPTPWAVARLKASARSVLLNPSVYFLIVVSFK